MMSWVQDSFHSRFPSSLFTPPFILFWPILLFFSTIGCSVLSGQEVTPTRLPRWVATSTPLPTLLPTATPLSPKPSPTVTPTPTRSGNLNPLTGLTVDDPALIQRRPFMVRIGNDPQIRPQSGLDQADLVYEEIMDGWWVTRLTAVYLSRDPEVIGPIRSARLINLELAPQFDAALVHSGASDEIRWRISQSDIVDLDEYFHSTPYYYVEANDWRGRLFTSGRALREYLNEKGLEKAVPLGGFFFSPEGSPPPPGHPPAEDFVIPYPKNSVVEYRYDPSGSYLRFVQGEPHMDAVSGEQLKAANVIVQHAEHQKTDIVEDSLGTTSINIVLTGEGKIELFRDGVMIQGIWKRGEPREMTQYLNDKGKPLPLKPGNTWIQVVPIDYEVELR